MLGRYPLGSEAPLLLQCTTAAGVPTKPDSSPSARIYSGTTLIAAPLMPIIEPNDATGLFLLPLFLNASYAVGFVDVVFLYSVASQPLQKHDRFEIVPGGGFRGTTIALYRYQRPEQQLLIIQSTGGQLQARRNPR